MRADKKSDTNFPLYTKCTEHIKIPTRIIVAKRLFDQVSKTLCGQRSVWEYQNYVPVPVSSHTLHAPSLVQHNGTRRLDGFTFTRFDCVIWHEGSGYVQRVGENNIYAELPSRPCHFPSACIPLYFPVLLSETQKQVSQPWPCECCRRTIRRKCSTLRIAFSQL